MLTAEKDPLLQKNLEDLAELYGVATEAVIDKRVGKASQLFAALKYCVKPGLSHLQRRKWGIEDSGVTRTHIPTTELGQLGLRYWKAVDRSLARCGKEYACAEAEPRIIQTLDTLQEKRPLPADKERSLLFVDEDSTPIALRKNQGKELVLVLRESPLLPQIPAGTILETALDELWGLPYLGSDMNIVSSANRQLAVTALRKPHATSIIRPSVFSLSDQLAESYDLSSILRADLKPYALTLWRTSLEKIVKRVDTIATDAKVI